MATLIITPDDDSYDVNSPTFLAYGTKSKELLYTRPKQAELNSEELAGQGRPTFRPFGIASDEQFLYVVSHNKLGRFDKNNFEFCALVDVPLFINTHEMVVHNHIIYVANTSNDTIGIYDLKTKEPKFFSVVKFNTTAEAPIPDNVESHDGAHVNSLCYHDNKIYFCLHHLDRRDSQLGYFDINTYETQIVAEAGRCNHGVQVLNNKLYSLSTGTGEVIEVDLVTRDVTRYKVVDSTKTFLRGLDILDGDIVFGGSNTYSEERTIYMNNCFAATFNVATKKASVLMQFDEAYIISDMKVIR